MAVHAVHLDELVEDVEIDVAGDDPSRLGYHQTGKVQMSGLKAYDAILDFIAAGTGPEAVVAFRPSPQVQERVRDLIDRRQAGTLSADEESELEEYLQLEHLMVMAKARARQRFGG